MDTRHVWVVLGLLVLSAAGWFAYTSSDDGSGAPRRAGPASATSVAVAATHDSAAAPPIGAARVIDDGRAAVDTPPSDEPAEEAALDPRWIFAPGGADGAWQDLEQLGEFYDPAEFVPMSAGMIGFDVDANALTEDQALDIALERSIRKPKAAAQLLRANYDAFTLERALGMRQVKDETRRESVRAIVEAHAARATPLLDALDSLCMTVVADRRAARDFIVFRFGGEIPRTRAIGRISVASYRSIGPWYIDGSIDFSGHAAIEATVRELEELAAEQKSAVDQVLSGG